MIKYFSMGAFKILQTKAGKYAFRLLGANGQTLLSSESFNTRPEAESTIAIVAEVAQSERNFERRNTTNGEYYFVLKGNTGRILAKSGNYASEAGLENGIWSAIKNSNSVAVV